MAAVEPECFHRRGLRPRTEIQPSWATTDKQEALRMRVMAALGEGMSAAEAVRMFGVSQNSIRNWKAR